MTDRLFRRILVPVASVEDAENTCEQVHRVLRDDGGEVLVVHVVEKAGGAPDKASVEQRDEWAREMFDVAEDELSVDGVTVETDVLYGTDVVDAVLAAADGFDASAVVFTPRGGSRWVQLLTGDTARGLMERADRPVVVLPDADEEGSDRYDADEGPTDADGDEPTDGEVASSSEPTGREGRG